MQSFLFYFLWKVVSGDDDLPKRDDIGERRRKHELRVLAGAGIKSQDEFGDEDGNVDVDADEDDDMEESDTGDSEDEYYKQVKQLRAAKLAAKAEMYSRCDLLLLIGVRFPRLLCYDYCISQFIKD